MADLMLKGPTATIHFMRDPENGQTVATCTSHWVPTESAPTPCSWTERFDTLDAAAEYAADHADRG